VPYSHEVIEFCDDFARDMAPVIAKRRTEIKAGTNKIDDCLTVMLEENMSEKEIKDHMITLICAGHDTTAYFSAFFVYMMGKHPEIQEKVRKEINTVMGNRSEVTGDDIYNMKYMLLVMKEVLRLYAVIPCVSRYSEKEVNIKEKNGDRDVVIPKGVDILIPMFAMNRSAELWEDPHAFKPERWEGKGADFTAAGYGFFPFGFGSRVCIGYTLAYMESSIFMTQLLRSYLVEEEPGFSPKIAGGISLTTSNGVKARLKKL
jgi:cytochrome P450